MLNILEKKNGDISILNLIGELNFSNASRAEQQFSQSLESNPSVICINCAELNTIDSSGLGVLISLSKKLVKLNISMVICELNDNISTLFDFSKLSHFFKTMSMAEFEAEYLS